MDGPAEFQPLPDETFRERILRARAEKEEGILSLTGLDLFELELAQMREGIRAEFPEFTAEQVEAELCQRIAREREEQERGFYSSEPPK